MKAYNEKDKATILLMPQYAREAMGKELAHWERGNVMREGRLTGERWFMKHPHSIEYSYMKEHLPHLVMYFEKFRAYTS